MIAIKRIVFIKASSKPFELELLDKNVKECLFNIVQSVTWNRCLYGLKFSGPFATGLGKTILAWYKSQKSNPDHANIN